MTVFIRLSGLPEEVDHMVQVLRDADTVEILECSEFYPIRVDSNLVSCYVTVQKRLRPTGEVSGESESSHQR
jgi:hypothetical protein